VPSNDLGPNLTLLPTVSFALSEAEATPDHSRTILGLPRRVGRHPRHRAACCVYINAQVIEGTVWKREIEVSAFHT